MNPYEKKSSPEELEQLRRWKYSPPEYKLEWLAAAVEFAYAKK